MLPSFLADTRDNAPVPPEPTSPPCTNPALCSALFSTHEKSPSGHEGAAEGGSVAGRLALPTVPHLLGVTLHLDGGGMEAESALQPGAGLLQHLLRAGTRVCKEQRRGCRGVGRPQIHPPLLHLFPGERHSLMAMCTESSGCAAVSAQMWRLCTAATPSTASSVSCTALKSIPLGVPGEGEPQALEGWGPPHPRVTPRPAHPPVGPYPP